MEMKQEKGLEGKEQEPKNPKLLDQVRQIIKVKHYSIRTEESYIQWIKRYIVYHKKKHPKDMRERAIEEFLSYLANECKVITSTLNQVYLIVRRTCL